MKGAKCLDNIRLLIHLGEISGDHFNMGACAKEVWRVNEDGQLRDRYGKLTYLFEMSDKHFLNPTQTKIAVRVFPLYKNAGRIITKCMMNYRNFLFPMYGWQKLWHLNYRNLQLFILVF